MLEGLEVEDGQKIDGFELPINGRLAADFRTEGEIGTHESGRAGSKIRLVASFANMRRQRSNPPICVQVPVPIQLLKDRPSFFLMLTGERTASKEVALIVAGSGLTKAFPQQLEDVQAAMVFVDASASDFYAGAAHIIRQNRQIELVRCIESNAFVRLFGRLHAVGAHDRAARPVTDKQMIARGIECVLVFTGQHGRSEAFFQLEVENFES